MMTVEELAAMPMATVGTKEAAAVMGCDRYTITLMAKHNLLPCRYFFSGNRLHIVKQSLLEYLGHSNPGRTEPAGG